MEFVVHDEPVRREASNWIARIALEPFGFPGQWEQVWLRRTEGALAEVCCIPLLAHGVALGDVVRLSRDGATVVGVVRRSGRRVFRALLMVERDEELAEAVGEIESRCAASGVLVEWLRPRFVAIDFPPSGDPSGVLEYLAPEVEAGRVAWEWGEALPFKRLRRWGRGRVG